MNGCSINKVVRTELEAGPQKRDKRDPDQEPRPGATQRDYLGPAPVLEEDEASHSIRVSLPPNGSRLSCGRNTRGRKVVKRQTKRLASEATQFFPTGERPAASSAC